MQCERYRKTHLEFYHRGVTDGMTSPWSFLWMRCQRVFWRWPKGARILENTVQLVIGLGFDSAMKDADHDALWKHSPLEAHNTFATWRKSGRLFVEMSLMTTATAERDFVRDDNKKRCYITLDSTRSLHRPRKVQTMIRPTSSQTVHHHHRRGYFNCRKFLFQQSFFGKGARGDEV